MSKNVRNLKSKIKGIKAVILIKDREIVLSEFDDAKAERLSQSMHYLINDIKEIHDVEGMMIAAEHGKFFIFNRENSFLGILSEAETNFPFLKLLVRKVLPLEEKEEFETEVPPEEIPFFLRISISDYYKKYPREHEDQESSE